MTTSLRKSVPHPIHVQRSQNNHRLNKALHCKSRGQGSTPGKDRFSVHRSQHLYSLISVSLTFLCTTRTIRSLSALKIQRPPFDKTSCWFLEFYVNDPTPTFRQYKTLLSSWSFTLKSQRKPFGKTRRYSVLGVLR